VPADVDPVISALEEALARGSGDASTLRLHLATLYLAASRWDDAFASCREVLLDAPGNADALEFGARACRGLGQSERAARYAAAAEAVSRIAEPADAGPPAAVVPLRVVGAPAEERTGTGERVTLADVAGMDAVKRRLKLAFLAPLANPELRKLYGKSLLGGLLLWGPPGCGKTFVARAVAGELGAAFIPVGLDDVLDMWQGQSERNLHELFEEARRRAPCMLFFDEIDALGQKRSHLRGSAGRNLVVQMLAELDGIDQLNDGVFVLGATNHPWDVDTALRRPGRFDRVLLVMPPDEAARLAILTAHLASRPTEGLDLAALARVTDRFSGADLVHLCDGAAELALEQSIETGLARPIRQADFQRALTEVKETTSAWVATARNHAEFSADRSGVYDELLDYVRARSTRNRSGA
jgi:SpoVK/Ycf46/Vps4 family AAA+-type ATPase